MWLIFFLSNWINGIIIIILQYVRLILRLKYVLKLASNSNLINITMSFNLFLFVLTFFNKTSNFIVDQIHMSFCTLATLLCAHKFQNKATNWKIATKQILKQNKNKTKLLEGCRMVCNAIAIKSIIGLCEQICEAMRMLSADLHTFESL